MPLDTKRPEVFRGHLKECLTHLQKALESRALKGSRLAGKSRQPIANFCGVKNSTVYEWLAKADSNPAGVVLLRLYCCLDLMGYRVIEFERMPKVQRNYAELIGFGLLTNEEAFSSVGYNRISSLLAVFSESEGISDEKKQAMWDIWKSRREELGLRKDKAAKTLKLLSPKRVARPRQKQKETGHPLVIPAFLPEVEIPAQDMGCKNPMDKMRELLRLLDEGGLFNLPPDEFAALLPETNVVLGLAVHFNDLSSRIIIRQLRAKETSV